MVPQSMLEDANWWISAIDATATMRWAESLFLSWLDKPRLILYKQMNKNKDNFMFSFWASCCKHWASQYWNTRKVFVMMQYMFTTSWMNPSRALLQPNFGSAFWTSWLRWDYLKLCEVGLYPYEGISRKLLGGPVANAIKLLQAYIYKSENTGLFLT